jgi:hypothetical protein
MKKRFSTYVLLLLTLSVASQVHVSVGSPDTWTVQSLAPYIGQTVEFDVPMVVCSNMNRLVVGPWRVYEPFCQGARNTIGYSTAVKINNLTTFTLSNVPDPEGEPWYRCGEKIYHLQAVVKSTSELSYVKGEWVGNKRADLEQSLPDLGDYRLLVCAMNLENYFVVNMGSLGAKTHALHEAQRAKISKALAHINADIFGLVELEQGNDAIEEIVADLNANHPERNYTFFRESTSAAAYQKSDFVYDANVVEPIGTPVVDNTEVQNRKKLLCFREKATGERFIYSINHFKAMTGGAEATDSRRENEARAMINKYNSYRRNSSIKDNDFLLMGDLNTYAFTDPIKVFTDNGLIDLHRAFHADSSYSYMYGGRASYIDHALCNSTIYAQITGMSAYHINSDESDYYTYDKSSDRTMFRSSDHDPMLVGLKLDSTLVYDPSPQINSAEIVRGDANTIVLLNAYKDEQKSYYAIYSISGFLLERQEIRSLYHEVTLPANTGVYIVYIYAEGQVFQRKVIVR